MRKEIEGKRFYETPVGLVPSVTTILNIIDKGPWYAQWLIQNSQQTVDQTVNTACDLGTRVHEKIEQYIKAKINGDVFNILDCIDDERPCIEAFLEWENKHRVHYVSSEQFVWSKHGYAGTMDIKALVDDFLTQVDIKTSKAFHDTYGLQLSAYSKGDEEQNKKKIEKQMILRLDKVNGMPHQKYYPNKFGIFLSAKRVWEWRNEGLLKRIKQEAA